MRDGIVRLIANVIECRSMTELVSGGIPFFVAEKSILQCRYRLGGSQASFIHLGHIRIPAYLIMIIEKRRDRVSVCCRLQYIGHRWYFIISTIITLNDLGIAAAAAIHAWCQGSRRRMGKRLVNIRRGPNWSTVPGSILQLLP